jgi:hypothetical protein
MTHAPAAQVKNIKNAAQSTEPRDCADAYPQSIGKILLEAAVRRRKTLTLLALIATNHSPTVKLNVTGRIGWHSNQTIC